MKTLFTIAIVLSIASAMVSIDNLLAKEDKVLMNQFASWMIKHRKTHAYKSHYEAYARFQVFKENLNIIEDLNNDDLGAVFGTNKFSDLTAEEFKATYTNLKINQSFLPRAGFEGSDFKEAPASFDWREHGAVTKVKDQGQCGSCWAFGTIAAIEGQYFMEDKTLRSFSEEELVDCDHVDEGCNGGLQENAFDYLKTHGFMLESDYPYVSGVGLSKHKCKYEADKTYGTVKSYSTLSRMRKRSLLPLPKRVPLPTPSTLAFSNITGQESSKPPPKSANKAATILTMPLPSSDTVLKVKLISGPSRTLGPRTGVRKATSELKEVPTPAVLLIRS